jgi:hypothetical protein
VADSIAMEGAVSFSLPLSALVQLRVKSFATLAPNLSPTITTTTTTTHYNYVNTACFWT